MTRAVDMEAFPVLACGYSDKDSSPSRAGAHSCIRMFRNTEYTKRTEKEIVGATSVSNQRCPADAGGARSPVRSHPYRLAISVSSVCSVLSVVIAHQRSRNARSTQCSDDLGQAYSESELPEEEVLSSPKAEEAEDDDNNDDQSHKINDVVHEMFLSESCSWLCPAGMP